MVKVGVAKNGEHKLSCQKPNKHTELKKRKEEMKAPKISFEK